MGRCGELPYNTAGFPRGERGGEVGPAWALTQGPTHLGGSIFSFPPPPPSEIYHQTIRRQGRPVAGGPSPPPCAERGPGGRGDLPDRGDIQVIYLSGIEVTPPKSTLTKLHNRRVPGALR